MSNKRNFLSMASLLARLSDRGTSKSLSTSHDDTIKTTTLRLDADVRNFYECQASELGVSYQNAISLVLRGVMDATQRPALLKSSFETNQLSELINRFFIVFASHHISTTDIPRLIGEEHGISLSTLDDRKSLLDALDDTALSRTSDIFNINKNWLKGLSSPVAKAQCWYKQPESFIRRVTELNIKHCKVEVVFFTRDGCSLEKLTETTKKEDSIESFDFCPVISIEDKISGIEFKRYEVWETQRWNYSKCREQLRCMMYFLEKSGTWFHARNLHDKLFSELSTCKRLVSQVLNDPLYNRHQSHWHLDQLCWSDERNPERGALKRTQALFAKHKFDQYVSKCSGYCSPDEWDKFIRERNDISQYWS